MDFLVAVAVISLAIPIIVFIAALVVAGIETLFNIKL